jgi:hypothetical protein
MIIVLFFSKGLMGDREISFRGLLKKRGRKPKTPAEVKEGEIDV